MSEIYFGIGLRYPSPAKPRCGYGWRISRVSLNSICKAMEDGGRTVTIDVKKIEKCLFEGDGPAYKLLEAMKSVIEHEGYDGYKGAPRLVLALLWKLQELSNR